MYVRNIIKAGTVQNNNELFFWRQVGCIAVVSHRKAELDGVEVTEAR